MSLDVKIYVQEQLQPKLTLIQRAGIDNTLMIIYRVRGFI